MVGAYFLKSSPFKIPLKDRYAAMHGINTNEINLVSHGWSSFWYALLAAWSHMLKGKNGSNDYKTMKEKNLVNILEFSSS